MNGTRVSDMLSKPLAWNYIPSPKSIFGQITSDPETETETLLSLDEVKLFEYVMRISIKTLSNCPSPVSIQ